MAIGARRASFYVSVLAIGFVVGGFLSALMDRFLPQGPAKEFFTWTVSPSIGPFHINLLVVNMTLGRFDSSHTSHRGYDVGHEFVRRLGTGHEALDL